MLNETRRWACCANLLTSSADLTDSHVRSARNNTNTGHQMPVANQSSLYQTPTFVPSTQTRTYQAPAYQAPTYRESFNLIRLALSSRPVTRRAIWFCIIPGLSCELRRIWCDMRKSTIGSRHGMIGASGRALADRDL